MTSDAAVEQAMLKYERVHAQRAAMSTYRAALAALDKAKVKEAPCITIGGGTPGDSQFAGEIPETGSIKFDVED